MNIIFVNVYKMTLDLHGIDKLPTKYYGGNRVTEATSIFKEKAGELMCYFCDFGEKEGMHFNNGVTCQNPKSPVGVRTTSATNSCRENSEGVIQNSKREKQLELGV